MQIIFPLTEAHDNDEVGWSKYGSLDRKAQTKEQMGGLGVDIQCHISWVTSRQQIAIIQPNAKKEKQEDVDLVD